MIRLKTFLSIFLALLPMVVSAQYSGYVGETILLEGPNTDNYYSFPDLWSAEWKIKSGSNCVTFVASHTSLDVLVAIKDKGTATLTCMAYYYNSSSSSPVKHPVAKTYTITCLGEDPKPDNCPYNSNCTCGANCSCGINCSCGKGGGSTGKDKIYHTKTIEGVDITLVKYDGVTMNGSQFLCADGYYYQNKTTCVNKTTTGTVTIPSSHSGYDVKEIERYAFYECANIDKVIIPNTVSIIEEEAFSGCGLHEIVFGNSVKYIKDKAFYHCENLKKIELPTSVEYVRDFAFSGCSNVESITIPENIKSIGYSAFFCTNVKEITCLRKEPLVLTNDPFGSNTIYNNAVLYVPQGSIEKYRNAKYWTKFTTIKEIGKDIKVTSISIDPQSSPLTVGNTLQLTPTVLPNDATDNSVSWSSSNTSVATVSSSGLVTAKSVGSATITCKANDGSGKSASCSITVESGKVEPTSISLPYSISVKVDESKTVTYTLTPSNATTSITWKSDDNTIATVSSSGVVTGVKAGTTKVRATTSNGKTDYCNVTVEGIDPISISLPSSKTVKVGDSFTMSYTLNPSNATTTLTWTSDDSSIATVSSSGVVTGKKVGSTYINVKTANGKSDYCKVTVEKDVVLVSSISLDPSAVTLNVNETKQLTATILPSNATDKNVTWTSSNTSVATVSSSGLVTAKSAGSATITCKANDGSGKSATCSVTVSSYGITGISFVSLTCDNENLCKLKNSDVIKAHLTIKNIGETGLVQTRIRTYDDNDEDSKYWHSTSELSQIVFMSNETKTIDFDVPLKDAKKGSYYLALAYFDDKDQKWYYYSESLKKIAIVDNVDLKGDGSRNNPYNSAAANAYAASLKPDEITTNDVYVTGIVSSVINDYYDGSVTLYISEDGNDNNRFHVRYSYYKWDYYSSGKLPQKGDKILVKGKLRYYKGNIPEAYYAYVLHSSDAYIFDFKLVTLSENGYATFYSSESAYALPSGLSAQVVTGCSNNKLTYKTIADGSVSGIIPKATAVMLVSDNKSAGTFTLTPSESTVNYSGTNYLHGSDESTITTASGSNYYYKLTNGNAGTEYADVFGWYWGAHNGGAFQIEGNKAWLALPKTSVTRSAFAIDDDATEIDDVLENRGEDVYYDMQGRRISKPSVSGMYIINGKKVLINKNK